MSFFLERKSILVELVNNPQASFFDRRTWQTCVTRRNPRHTKVEGKLLRLHTSILSLPQTVKSREWIGNTSTAESRTDIPSRFFLHPVFFHWSQHLVDALWIDIHYWSKRYVRLNFQTLLLVSTFIQSIRQCASHHFPDGSQPVLWPRRPVLFLSRKSISEPSDPHFENLFKPRGDISRGEILSFL